LIGHTLRVELYGRVEGLLGGLPVLFCRGCAAMGEALVDFRHVIETAVAQAGSLH